MNTAVSALATFLCLGVSISFTAMAAEASKSREVRLAPPNAAGHQRFTANLQSEAVHATDSSAELPALDTRDPRNAADFRARHQPKVRALVKQLEHEYGLQAISMTSYAAPTFTAYMPASVVDRLRLDQRVFSVIPVYEAYDFSAWSDQWDGDERISWGKIAIGTNDTRRGGGTVVYIIDGGAPPHDDLLSMHDAVGVDYEGNPPPPPSPEHAVHVAGIIAAELNGAGTRGVDPGITVININSGLSDDHAKDAIDWALADSEARGVFAVANISRNSERWRAGHTSELDHFIRRLSNRALVVQSAGNQGLNACDFAYSPTVGGEGVLVVGGIDDEGLRAAPFDNTHVGWGTENGSNSGPCVEVWAPAQMIWSAWTAPARQYLSGTSMAAPHVAALAARFGNTTTTPVQREHHIRARLFSTSGTDPINGQPLKVPSYTITPTYAIPAKLPVSSVRASANEVSAWNVNNGTYLPTADVWNAGANSGWVTLGLSSPRTVTGVRLTPERTPIYGQATHYIFADNNYFPTTLVATVSGAHNILEPILVSFPGVYASTVRVESYTGDSWTAWREIEVYGY